MKRIISFVVTLCAAVMLFAATTAHPSLDGRALVADAGVMPKGLFARTVGYLPGDSVTVSNPATGAMVDVLIIGAIDPSGGVAILLSPEAASALGIRKDSNVQVKITKRTGGLDETVSGTAVLAEGEDDVEDSGADDEDIAVDNVGASAEATEEPSALSAEETSSVETTDSASERETESPAETTPLVEEAPSAEAVSERESEVEPEPLIVANFDDDEPYEDDAESAPASEKVEPEPPTEFVTDDDELPVSERVITDSRFDDDEPYADEPTAVEPVLDDEHIAFVPAPKPLPAAERVDERIPEMVAENPAHEVVPNTPVPSEDIPDDEVAPPPVSPRVEEFPAEEEEDFQPIILVPVHSQPPEEAAVPETPPASAPQVTEYPVEAETEPDDEALEYAPVVLEPTPAVTTEPEEYTFVDADDTIDNEYRNDSADVIESELPTVVAEVEAEEPSPQPTAPQSPVEETPAPIAEPPVADAPVATTQPLVKETPASTQPQVPVEETPVLQPPVEETAPYPPIVVPPAPTPQPSVSVEEMPQPPVEETVPQPAVAETRPAPAPRNDDGIEQYIVPSLKDLQSGSYYIQIAALSDKLNIKQIINQYGAKYPIVLVPLSSGKAYQVLVGPLTVDEYGTVMEKFKSFGYKDAFLRKIR